MAWKFNSMIAEIKDFVTAVIEDRPPRIVPAEAVERSIQTGQPVNL